MNAGAPLIIRVAPLFALTMISTVPAPARSQDHSDHAAHMAQSPRTLGGVFALRAIDGRTLPTALREGADARIVAGSLTLMLVRPDSGRYARSSSVAAWGGSAVESTEQGVVLVRGDMLLFRPEGIEPQASFRERHAWTAERALELTDALGHVWRYVATGADPGFAGVQARCEGDGRGPAHFIARVRVRDGAAAARWSGAHRHAGCDRAEGGARVPGVPADGSSRRGARSRVTGRATPFSA